MCLFHKWTKWEQYEEEGTSTGVGLLVPRELRGIAVPYSESRQKKHCLKCGKIQDELIKDS